VTTTDRLKRVAGPVLVLLVGALAGRLVTVVHGSSTAPWGVLLGYGAIYGSGTALSTVGLVLVYRSARVINFSQALYGVNASLLFLLLTTGGGGATGRRSARRCSQRSSSPRSSSCWCCASSPGRRVWSSPSSPSSSRSCSLP
jgi:hypothetical protein